MKSIFKKLFFCSAAILFNISSISASSLGVSISGDGLGYLSSYSGLYLELSKEVHMSLSGIYFKKESASWAGEKYYEMGLGLSSKYTGGDFSFSVFKGVDDYSISTLGLVLNMDINNILIGADSFFSNKGFWGDFHTSFAAGIYYAWNVKGLTGSVSRQSIISAGPLLPPPLQGGVRPPLIKQSTSWTLNQTALSMGLTETVFKNTIVGINGLFYSYSIDVSVQANPVSQYQYRYDKLLGTVSDFPSRAFLGSVTEYLFDYNVYLYLGYINTVYVAAAPSDSYVVTVGGFPFKGIELYVSYNKYVDPARDQSIFYTFGGVLYF